MRKSKSLEPQAPTGAIVNAAEKGHAFREGLTAPVASEAPQEQIGELHLVPLEQIRVDARFRRDLGDIPMLASSIEAVGLIHPILLTPDLELVAGARRVQAYRHLGREQVLARVVDIEDVAMASLEEDRARKPLTPTERYAVTEALRDKMRDEAWRRRALGGRLEQAVERGRADDLLASHVHISRPTLRKIRTIVEAARQEPERYGMIAVDLDRDSKVDKHYRRYLVEKAKDDPTPRFKVAVFAPSWQMLDEDSLRRAIRSLGLAARAEDGAVLLVPSCLSTMARASELVSFAKFTWQSTLLGSDADSEHLWLLACLGKTLPEDEILTWLAESCRSGYSETLIAAEVVSDSAALVIDLSNGGPPSD